MDAEFLRDLFASFRSVDVRRLFRDVMFALLSSQGALYLKVDENNEPDFVREGLPPFEYERNGVKRAMKSYRKMPERLYDDPDELAQWASRALAAALSKSATRQKTVKRAGEPKSKSAKTSNSASKSVKTTRTTKAGRLTKR